MTHGDFEDYQCIVADYHIFMNKDIRMVICPTGEIVAAFKDGLQQCFNDISTWAMPVYNNNQ